MIRYTRRHPVSGFLLGILLLAALNTALRWAWVLSSLLPGGLVVAGAAAYAIGRHAGARAHRNAPTARDADAAAADAEVTRLRSEVAALRDQHVQAGAAVALAVCWLEQAHAGGKDVPVDDLIWLALDELLPQVPDHA